MASMTIIRKRHIWLMRTTVQTLGHILAGISQTTATTLRDPDDGDAGWTVTEVVCHLRDFDGFFLGRARQMLAEDYPNLPAYDHEAIAIERDYNNQSVAEAYAALVASRHTFVDFFRGLSDAQWERAGVHPENGHWTMTDSLMQVGLHDTVHIEQIMRILTQRPK